MALVGPRSTPAAQGMMTRRVSPSEQGQLQGALGGIQRHHRPDRPGALHPHLRDLHQRLADLHLPGAPFLLAALLLTAATALAARVTRPALPVAATSAEASP